MSWNPRLVKTPVPMIFATTIALAVVKRQTPDDALLNVAGMALKAERVVDA